MDELVTLSDSMTHVWNFFLRLDRHRSSNGYGVNPLSWADIKAFFDIHSIVPEEYELLAISMLDGIRLECIRKEIEKESKKK